MINGKLPYYMRWKTVLAIMLFYGSIPFLEVEKEHIIYSE